MQKCLGLQKLHSDLKTDLQQEIGMIDRKLLTPAQDAKAAMKPLQKTLKHRDNMKLDYERYLSRAQHAQKKETRSAKEEAALAVHENNLAQAQIDYQTADEQVKQTFPPVTEAVLQLMPYLLASQVMLQTTLVGQLYTVLDTYTRKHRLPNPAPSDGEIIDAWEREFEGFRRELEQSIATIANGKAVKMPMTLPEQAGSSLTGLGLRNKAGGLGSKAGGLMHRKSSQQSTTGQQDDVAPQRPMIGSRQNTQGLLEAGPPTYDEEEEAAPPKPPRPAKSPMGMPSPAIPMGSKPRIPSSSALSTVSNWERNPPPPYEQASGGATPPSRYQTPLNGFSSPNNGYLSATNSNSNNNDYFSTVALRRASQASSVASTPSAMSALAAGKKKPPPIPTKRIPSSSQAQYVTAVYDFEGQNEGDLVFREGDRIRVVKKTESTDDWWDGEVGGRVGVFPANYVRM